MKALTTSKGKNMSVTINKEDYDENNAPTQEDGSEFPYIMVGVEKIIFSEGFGGLVDALFDDGDYSEQDVDDQLELRHDLAVAIATQAQAGVFSHLTELGTLDTSVLSEPEINLLFNSKDVPHEHGGEWNAKDTDGDLIPLFLVTTHYSPFTEVDPVAPSETVLYVDPTDEERFIRSLSALGVVDLYTEE